MSPARSEPRDKSRDKKDKNRKSKKETKDSKESKDKKDKEEWKSSTEKEKKRRDEEQDDDVDEGDGEGYREEGKEEGDAVAMDEEFDPETGKALKRRMKIAGVEYSELPYHDFTSPSEQTSFRQACEALKVGRIVMARLYDAVDCSETDAAFLIREIKDYEDGPMLGADFTGASKPAGKILIEISDKVGENMIHLCREYPDCVHFSNAANALQLSKWKDCSACQMDAKWFTAGFRRKCAKPKKRKGQKPLAPPRPPSPAPKPMIKDGDERPLKKSVADGGAVPDSNAGLPAGPPTKDNNKKKRDNTRKQTLPPALSPAKGS